MDPEARTAAWQTVEHLFGVLHIPIGTAFPVAIMVEVRSEEAILDLRNELTRAGLDVYRVDRKRWPFGRRWQLGAKSGPQPISRVEVESWLDSLEPLLAKHDAAALGWVPLVPAA